MKIEFAIDDIEDFPGDVDDAICARSILMKNAYRFGINIQSIEIKDGGMSVVFLCENGQNDAVDYVSGSNNSVDRWLDSMRLAYLPEERFSRHLSKIAFYVQRISEDFRLKF